MVLCPNTLAILSAARTGTVDFSTTIFLPCPASTVSAIILGEEEEEREKEEQEEKKEQEHEKE